MSTPFYSVDPDTREATLQMFSRLIARLPLEGRQFVEDGTEIIYLAAQVNVPVGSGPNAGALQRSMDRFISDDRGELGIISGKVTMMNRQEGQKPYAWMREKGGTIVPRPENRLQRLVWTDEGGNLIFARQVTQDGAHYMEGALLQTVGEVREQAGIMLQRFVKFRD